MGRDGMGWDGMGWGWMRQRDHTVMVSVQRRHQTIDVECSGRLVSAQRAVLAQLP
jgi:hypothetical protein